MRIIKKVARFSLTLSLAVGWIFSGWPQIFNFPPKIQEAQAITCGFGSDIGGGQCRGFLTDTGAATFTVPDDWNSSNNSIETIGGGGGGCGHSGVAGTGGGGGGAYSKITNLALTPAASADIQVGLGGAFRGAGED